MERHPLCSFEGNFGGEGTAQNLPIFCRSTGADQIESRTCREGSREQQTSGPGRLQEVAGKVGQRCRYHPGQLTVPPSQRRVGPAHHKEDPEAEVAKTAG